MYTVEQLRQKNCRVRVHHNRVIDTRDFSVFPRGGSTRVEITLPNGETRVGEARCSDKDNYNKKRSVLICTGRALSGVEI